MPDTDEKDRVFPGESRDPEGNIKKPLGGPEDGDPLTPKQLAELDQMEAGLRDDLANTDPLQTLAAGESAISVNPIQDLVESNLGTGSPSNRSSTGSSPSFRPTVGRPDAASKKTRTSSSESGSSSSSSSGSEAKTLSDLINNARDDRLASLKKDEDNYKKGKYSKFNILGRGRRRAKRIVIGAVISSVAAVGAAVVGIVPQALDSFLTSSTSAYSNFSTEAIVKRAFNRYFKENVLVPKCRERTGNNPVLSNKCNVATSTKTSLWGRAIEDMRSNKMDEKLRTKGIQWDYDPDTDRYIVFQSKDGSAIPDFSKGIDYDNFDIFEMGKNEGSKFIDSTVRDVINNETRWKKYFIRGPTVRAMRTRTGSSGCFFLCKNKDSFNEKKKWPKKAFARLVKTNLLNNQNGLLSNIADCVISGGEGCSSRKTREYMRGKVAETAAKMFDEEFAENLLKAFDGTLDKGISRFVLEEAVKKIGLQITEKAATNIVGVLLLIRLIGKTVDSLQTNLPKVLRMKSMLQLTLAASTFLIMINESRRGAIPLADYGQMLSTFIGMGGSRIFASIFMGPDNKTAKNSQPYNCNNADEGGVTGTVSSAFAPAEIQSGDLTCKSFMLDYTPSFLDNSFLKGIGDAYNSFNSACVNVGVGKVCLDSAFDALDTIESIFGAVIGGVLEKLPGVSQIQNLIAGKSQELMQSVFTAVSPTIINGSFAGVGKREGARVFDALAGGSSVTNQYITPRDEMGAGTIDVTSQMELDSAIAEQQAQDTQYASFYDRFFNLDPTEGIGTSMLTQFASSALGTYNVANLVNPLQNLSMAFNSTSGGTTYASGASAARTISKAFAVPVKGFPLSVIEGAANGELDDIDPDSEQCKQEAQAWKDQIEERSDTSNDTRTDPLGFGIPDGDGSGNSKCKLVETSLKVMTTHDSRENDFPIDGQSIGGGSSDDSGSDNSPIEGALGKCESVAITRPNEGKPKNDIEIQVVPGTTIDIRADLCKNVLQMVGDAGTAGVILDGGGFRTYDEQVALRRSNCGSSNYSIYQASPSSCRPPTARPGFSNHESGTAIDFSNCSGRGTSCYVWLAANASKYGFKNFPDEPWHWSTNGK